MDEFNEIFSEKFFIIDSNKLQIVKSRLYGYLIDKDNIYTDKDIVSLNNISGIGTYVNINKTYNEIRINQDVDGSFGIYVYKHGETFCISNSFIKLVDYVKHKYPITFNEDCANALLSCKFSSFTYRQTLINEIEVLPRNFSVKIDIESRKISYESIDYEEKTIPLNSNEALEILDDWYSRWTSLFRKLKFKTNNITADLTGGFDSRLTFTLLLASNINLNEINVRSINDNNYTHKEDYQIASQIAKEFNFKLNDLSNFDINRYYFEEMETPLNLSVYAKLGFHNQLFYKYFMNLNTCYSITGYGGENIRDYHGVSSLETYINNANTISPEIVKSTQNILDYNINHIKKDFYNNYNDENIEYAIYREAVLRYHFGKGNIEKYLINEIGLNPLADPELNKIKRFDENCPDKNLLISIIYLRYFPKILDFDFEGDSEIDPSTIEYAKTINKKYPFKHEKYNPISKETQSVPNSKPVKPNIVKDSELVGFLKKTFLSNSFKKQFETYYSSEMYDRLALKVKTLNYVPLQYAYPAFAIMKILDDIKINNFNPDETLFDWLKKFEKIGSPNQTDYSIINKLMKYNTARIDLINHGNGNDIEFVDCSDAERAIRKPSWVKPSEGQGLIIESFKNSMDLTVKCIKSGKLTISIKSMDIRDKNRNRFPIYIDYTNFVVNDKIILKENKLVWHDQPYVHTLDVKDGEIITIHLDWKPFDNESKYK